MKEGRARTLDAKLDEVGINVRRVTNYIVATVEERRGRALVKQTVFSQTKMFQTIPLGAGLGVLGQAQLQGAPGISRKTTPLVQTEKWPHSPRTNWQVNHPHPDSRHPDS